MKYILNYENVENLKRNIDIFDINRSNKEIINDLFDDDVEFEINDIDVELKNIEIEILKDDELIINYLNKYHYKRFNNIYDLNNYIYDEIDELINIKKDNYIIDLLLIICTINNYKGSINENVYDKLNDELIKRFNKSFINYLYQYCLYYDIFLNDKFEYYDDEINYDDIFINTFLIYEYDYFIDQQLYHNKKYSYENNYVDIIDNITIYHDKYDFIECFIDNYDIDDFLKSYIDDDKLYDDLIDEYNIYEYENKIIELYYF